MGSSPSSSWQSQTTKEDTDAIERTAKSVPYDTQEPSLRCSKKFEGLHVSMVQRTMDAFSKRMYSDYESSQCFYVRRDCHSYCLTCNELGMPCRYATHVHKMYEELTNVPLSGHALQTLIARILQSGDEIVLSRCRILHTIRRS